MEHWNRMTVAPVEMGWSDIGSWDAIHDFAQEAGHAAAPDSNVVAINTEDCLIRSSGPLIAAVGLKDMIIVAPRSEEHTSELQSLIRISYAALCCTKQNRKHTE